MCAQLEEMIPFAAAHELIRRGRRDLALASPAGFLIAAVVHEPWGAHPSSVPGHYARDDEAFSEYDERSRRAEDFERLLLEWVLRVQARRE